MEKSASATVIHEIDALEQYLDEYLRSAGLTFDRWIERFDQEPYFTRNQVILRLLNRIRPKKVFEFACAGGFLAKLLLENIASIEHYTCSNISTRVVAYCDQQLACFSNCEVKLLDANIVRSNDIEHANIEQYDTFLTTSFEHIQYDRELINTFPKNRCFVFCVAGFDDPEHFRSFTGKEQITERYNDLLSIASIEALGEQDQKFVVMSWTARPSPQNA
jgi:SAM-dependent methyltransferase